MPTLLVLRHGKSDWHAAYATDAERPLAKRGRRAAAAIGRHLAESETEPELALTSPAVRARDTLTRVLDVAGFDCPVRTVESFYGYGYETVLDELRGLDDSYDTVLAVGHEPTWSDLIAALTGEHLHFPTAALARLDVLVPWTDIAPACAVLTALVLPRQLEGGRG